jgi:hypothetical protein
VRSLVTEDMLTMDPPRGLRITRISCFRQARIPSRLVANTVAKPAASLSAMVTGSSVPALLTAMSRGRTCAPQHQFDARSASRPQR